MKHAAKGGVVLAAANLCMNRRKEGIWQFAKAGYAAAAKNAKQNRKTSISKNVFDGSVVVAISAKGGALGDVQAQAAQAQG